MRLGWTRFLQVVVEDVVAALFPASCRSCGAELPESGPDPDWGALRRSCIGSFSLPLHFLCASCASRIRPTKTVSEISESIPCISAFEPGPELFELVHAFKYEGAVELVPWLGERLAVAAERGLPEGPVTLVPVPLHPTRLRERGYNQSALLSRVVADRLGLVVDEALLERQRPTTPQAALAPRRRRANVRGAFRIRKPVPERGVLVLVDDVVTSGQTAQAAIEALGVCVVRIAILTLCAALDSPGSGAR